MADAQYLQENVGDALTAGLASVAAAQPDDPVEYLAHWLLKYLAVQEKKAEIAEADKTMQKEKEELEEAESKVSAQRADAVGKKNAAKTAIAEATSLDQMYGTLVQHIREITRASNVYVALLEKRTPPEGEEEPPEPEPPAFEGELAEGEEPPPPPKLPPHIPKYCALKYVFSNDEQKELVVGKELASPDLGKKPSLSFKAVYDRTSVMVKNVMESDPPLIFHDMPMPGSFALHPLLSTKETEKFLAGNVMGVIGCDTINSDLILQDDDQVVLSELAECASGEYERLVEEARKRKEEEDEIARKLLEEEIAVPEDQVPGEEETIESLEGKIEAAVGSRLARVKQLMTEKTPPAKSHEHGRELLELSKFAEGSESARVAAAAAALVGFTFSAYNNTEIEEFSTSIHSFDVKTVTEEAVGACNAALNPEGAEKITAQSEIEFPAKLLFAYITVVVELSGPAKKLADMKAEEEAKKQAEEEARIAAEEAAAAEAAKAAEGEGGEAPADPPAE